MRRIAGIMIIDLLPAKRSLREVRRALKKLVPRKQEKRMPVLKGDADRAARLVKHGRPRGRSLYLFPHSRSPVEEGDDVVQG